MTIINGGLPVLETLRLSLRNLEKTRKIRTRYPFMFYAIFRSTVSTKDFQQKFLISAFFFIRTKENMSIQKRKKSIHFI